MRVSTRLGALGAAAVLSLTLTLTLTACSATSTGSTGSGTSSPTSAPGTTSSSADARHGPADVSFARDMTAHHRGAVEMAQLAATRASSAQVKDLAHRIEAAQGPEIDEMTSWLETWGATAASSSGSMGGMDHSSGSMGSGAAGMMSAEQMSQLTAASGPAFDRLFLQMMTSHHQGAIAMAETEQAGGSDPQALALARSIETSQSAEVTEMGRLLTALGS